MAHIEINVRLMWIIIAKSSVKWALGGEVSNPHLRRHFEITGALIQYKDVLPVEEIPLWR